MAATENIVYSASTDSVLKLSTRFSDSHSFEFTKSIKLEGSPIDISIGSNNKIYVLLNNSKIHALSEDLSENTVHEIKDYEPTAITQVGQTLWVGDKKGTIHILSDDGLQEVVKIEGKHKQSVTVMTTSKNG